MHIFVLGVVIMLLAFVGEIPFIGIFLAIGLGIWVVGRLSLVFPGIALDTGITFGLSWQLTKKYQLLMIGVVVLVPSVFSAAVNILVLIPYTSILISLLSTLAIVVEVAMLSIAYKNIMVDTYGQISLE